MFDSIFRPDRREPSFPGVLADGVHSKGSGGYEQTSESLKTRQRRFWVAVLSGCLAAKRQRAAQSCTSERQGRAPSGRLLLDRVV
jgi:hypothetical protein